MRESQLGISWTTPASIALFAISIVALAHASPARATVMAEVPLVDMAAAADAIVVGRVERTGVQLSVGERGTMPFTVTRIRVEEWLKGRGGAPFVNLRERGGEWAGGGMWIDGTPRYAVGEEVVVFLRRDPEVSRYFRTYGMAQGKFVIRRGAPSVSPNQPQIADTVVRDLSAISFATWSRQGMQVQAAQATTNSMALSDLLAMISRVVDARTPSIPDSTAPTSTVRTQRNGVEAVR